MRKNFKISFIVIIILVLVYIGYALFCNKKQIHISKQSYISFILNREIELRKLYAEKKGEGFSLTESEKKAFAKEESKFYRYCNSNTSSEYCTIETDINLLRTTAYTIFHKELLVNIKYKFDEDSIKFFNLIKTYTGQRGRKLHVEEKAYQLNILGWDSEFMFFNCEQNYLAYVEENIDISNKLIQKEQLTNIKGYIKDSRNISYRFDTFIKLENN